MLCSAHSRASPHSTHTFLRFSTGLRFRHSRRHRYWRRLVPVAFLLRTLSCLFPIYRSWSVPPVSLALKYFSDQCDHWHFKTLCWIKWVTFLSFCLSFSMSPRSVYTAVGETDSFLAFNFQKLDILLCLYLFKKKQCKEHFTQQQLKYSILSLR